MTTTTALARPTTTYREASAMRPLLTLAMPILARKARRRAVVAQLRLVDDSAAAARRDVRERLLGRR